MSPKIIWLEPTNDKDVWFYRCNKKGENAHCAFCPHAYPHVKQTRCCTEEFRCPFKATTGVVGCFKYKKRTYWKKPRRVFWSE